MNCKKCNSEIPEGSKFCPNCGENQNTTKNENILPISIAIVISVSIIAGAFMLVEWNKTQQQAIEKQKQYEAAMKIAEVQRQQEEERKKEEEKQKQMLQVCLDNVAVNYEQEWNNYCKDQGKPSNCRLHTNIARNLERKYDGVVSNCHKRFNDRSFDTSTVDDETHMYDDKIN